MKPLLKHLPFFLILIGAIFFRFYHLSSLPSGVNWDEISHGYNAYSLLLTGKDQWNQPFPIFNFRAYGDYPTTANLYLTLPFIKIFGLNALAIRLPAAILGTGIVILSYFLAQALFGSKFTSLTVMFLAAFSPWTLFPSRAVFQSNLSLFFTLAGLTLFFSGLKRPTRLFPATICLSLATYSYHNARIAIPLIIICLIISNFSQLKKLFHLHRLPFYLSALTLLALLLPNLLDLFSPTSLARNRWVGIINPTSINLINDRRQLFSGPKIVNLLLNNKVTFFGETFLSNLLNLLNPIPLFFEGSQNYQFNPPHTGLIFFIFLPFFYWGLFKTLKLSPLFFLTLLPAALTVGDFPSIRATLAVPFYYLFIAQGLRHLPRLLFTLILAAALVHFGFYWQHYQSYNLHYSSAWQYGYQDVVTYLRQNYSRYSQIFVTKKYGEPHEFILFYWPWDPQKYQNDPRLKWDFHSDWYWVNAFDKFVFLNDWDIPQYHFPKNSLLVTSPGNYPTPKSHLLDTVYFLDRSPAFSLVTYD